MQETKKVRKTFWGNLQEIVTMMIQLDHHLSPESNDYKERPTEAKLDVHILSYRNSFCFTSIFFRNFYQAAGGGEGEEGQLRS